MNKKLFIETFGCQMNVADSEEMNQHFCERGFIPTAAKEDADLILLNTCTVRQHAEQKALSYIGRLKNWKKNNPDRVLIVTGCAAERLKNTLKKRFPHIDLVAGAKDIEEFPQLMEQFFKSQPRLATTGLINQATTKILKTNSKDSFDWFKESEVTFGEGKLRPSGNSFVLGNKENSIFVTIMRGCNYSCSYCIVPFVRGREVYRPVNEILNEIRRKLKESKRNILLLGQTVNSYWYKDKMENGKSKIVDFSDLLTMINQIEGVDQICFMSPHPHYMTDKLIHTLTKCEKISSKIHLPVQSGSNRILKLMNRNYTREKYMEIAAKLKMAVPQMRLTTDFIVGFPTETEDDFKKTLALIDEVKFNSAFCFKYSARIGTKASQMPDDVPLKIKENRLARLLEKIETLTS